MEPEEFVIARIVEITTSAASRVHLLRLPQRPTFRAVRVQRIGSRNAQHLRGPAYPVTTRVQVDSYTSEGFEANAHLGASTLADEIRGDGLGANASGLMGWLGMYGGSPGLLRILNVVLDHDGTPEYEGGELRLVRVRQDYLISWAPP